ncbi:battenin-like [Condylostylus longicornis]|uniref:battenin-like n=1 Tax=Condylostylus longicornis TaxID=2530218 RepID=UPI00244DEC9D|nr:battenin-like [Condylostylus longicornis]XP_055385590.1 battenin-like [Condylostylus longicornis]XP_055385591.1 battenin-like [Condylostylus longicornis]XP_055385592.1 battenin-like [Condylostylus longicornis]XP_055385593.1 battenin-like [Condylostylus longicornis]XP_055385594.1 battenin-like [Condylostylus longicornis]
MSFKYKINEDETKNIENETASTENYNYRNPEFITDSNQSLSTKDVLSSNEEKPNDQNNTNQIKEETPKVSKPSDPQLWRDLLAFWFLGLCNNYGYVVMLSAAHDIIGKFDDNHKQPEEKNDRDCQIMSTGAILLADIIPSLMIKLLVPFLPFWVNVRVIIANLLTAAGFLLVGYSENQWITLIGVICTSLSSGLGEATFLGYSSRFNRNVVSTWSSGTGSAGVGGSLTYAALRSVGVSSLVTMLILLIVPVIECIAFWIILRKPEKSLTGHNINNCNNEKDCQVEKDAQQLNVNNPDEMPLKTLKEKLRYMFSLLKYMIPLGVVYVAEYFINQGLFELVYFKNASFDKKTQYRWLNVVYQIGVLISRSSVNLLTIDKLWIFPILQLINVAYFLTEVILYITPTIWIVFGIVLFEGLLGGGAYVNTFYKISKKVPEARRQFALSFVSISDAAGITLAGFIAIPVHNAICNIPAPNRL